VKREILSLTKTGYDFSKESIDTSNLVQIRNRLVEATKAQSEPGSLWVNITDTVMADAIMTTYGDALNRKILDSCVSEPHTIMEILNITKISQTTGYRRLLLLIKDNFLVSHHMVQRSGAKQVSSYISTFKEIEFRMSQNQELVRVKFQDTSNN
jgi:hypothetical protein